MFFIETRIQIGSLYQLKHCTSGKTAKKRKKGRKYAFAIRVGVLVAVKMGAFLFLPHCFRLRIKMWVTTRSVKIGVKPQITAVAVVEKSSCWVPNAGCCTWEEGLTVHIATRLDVEALNFHTLILRSMGTLNDTAVFWHLKEAGEGKRASVGLTAPFDRVFSGWGFFLQPLKHECIWCKVIYRRNPFCGALLSSTLRLLTSLGSTRDRGRTNVNNG